MATRRKPAHTPGNRAVAYVRVSTSQQAEEGLSLDDQRERLAAYCVARGLDLVATVADEGESAGKPLAKRTGGKQVLSLVRARAVDAVIVIKLDRAFRNVVDALGTVDAWDKAGVALHIVEMGGQSIDTQSPMGRMFFVMMAGVAEMERRLTAERTTAALAFKARNGQMRTNSTPPFGYRYDGEALAEVPAEQAAIRFAKETHAADGSSLRKTIAALTAAGYRNRAGTEFKLTQLYGMLRGSVRQMHAEKSR